MGRPIPVPTQPTPEVLAKADTIQLSRLQELETVIERGLKTFMEVGEALMEIRDKKLYKEQHATFEDYCEKRWGLKRPRAYELMAAAAIVSQVSEISDIPVETESHAAELIPLKDQPQKAAEAYAEAIEESDGKVTAKDIRKTVEKRTRPGRVVPAPSPPDPATLRLRPPHEDGDPFPFWSWAALRNEHHPTGDNPEWQFSENFETEEEARTWFEKAYPGTTPRTARPIRKPIQVETTVKGLNREIRDIALHAIYQVGAIRKGQINEIILWAKQGRRPTGKVEENIAKARKNLDLLADALLPEKEAG